MELEKGIYAEKDRFGWKIVHPVRNPDGSINWFNLWTGGSWWNVVKVAGVLAIIGFVTWSYFRDINTCLEVMKNPCQACMDIGGMLG